MCKSLICFSLIVFLLSCSLDENVSTHTVLRGEFSNVTLIEGTVEPVLTTTLSSPRFCDGVVVYLVEDGAFVEEGDIVVIIEFQQLQNQYDEITISLENAIAGLNKIQADLNMQYALLEAQVKTNEADTKIAQLDSLQLIFASPSQRRIKELELERAMINKNRFEKKIEALSIIQQSEIRRHELEIQRLTMRVQTMKDQLDALTIRAPKSGMAMRANSRLTGEKYQVGDPVWSNMALVVLPEFTQMKVIIMASETDYKNISVGDSVHFTFDAMPENVGIGRITQKAHQGRPASQGSRVRLFEIEASIDSVLVMPEPGFTANCYVVLRHANDVLTVPQIAIFDKDTIRVVYVQQNRGFEMRQVMTGISSLKESVVTAGLHEGEVIALTRPDAKLVRGLTALPDTLLIHNTIDDFL